MKKKTMLQKLGLLGLVSFLSYTAAVVFAPLAYPDYNWMAQAVSDLSAADAPSLALWNRLSALYSVCEVVCVTAVCLGMQGRKKRAAAHRHHAVCCNGVGLGGRLPDVPLSTGGYAGEFQDVMHMVVTAAVVLLSIVSLTLVLLCGRPAQGLPVLRHLCGDRACHDACRGAWHEARSHGIFRHCGALQRLCRNGLQRGAGAAPVFCEARKRTTE